MRLATAFALAGGLAIVDYVPDGDFERTKTFFNAIGGFGYEAVDATATVFTGTVNLGKRIAVEIDRQFN